MRGEVGKGYEKQYCKILTREEERSIVRYVKNKNRCLQGINKKDLTLQILDVLKIRDYCNKRCKCIALKLHECLSCHNIMKSVYNKAKCKTEDGKKPNTILPAAAKTITRKQLFSEPISEDESDVTMTDSPSEDDISSDEEIDMGDPWELCQQREYCYQCGRISSHQQ